MKFAVRYQSRSGNTKAVAEELAKAVGVTAESIDVPVGEAVDVLFIGGAVYAFSLDEALKTFIKSLAPSMVKSAEVFATGGFINVTGKIASLVKSVGIPVTTKPLCVKMGGGAGKALTDKQISMIEAFVNEIVKT
jgi:flavodoxin